MKKIIENMLCNRAKTIPVFSFPVAKLIGKSLLDFVTSSDAQAAGMIYVAQNYPVGAVFNMMDLSVEAEAFGAKVKFDSDKIPEVCGALMSDIEEVEDLQIPDAAAGRCSVFIDGIKKAKQTINNIPVFCGVIGPYSLACRLYGMSELMMECFDEPDKVKILLTKCSSFITVYISALKSGGADGVLLCEPAAGLLSPDMAEEFSFPYVKYVFDSVSDENFVVAYHNCGRSVAEMPDLLCELNADIYHFGNDIDLKALIPLLPDESIVSGNLDPLLLKTGDGHAIFSEIECIVSDCLGYPNFILSTGCDVPYDINTDNLNAFFAASERLIK